MKKYIKKYSHILFDFDGTIVDSEALILELLNDLLKSYGIKLNFKLDFNNFLDLNFFKRMYFTYYMIKSKKKFDELYLSRLNELQVFKGIPELLDILKSSGYSLNVLSFNSEINIKSFFQIRNINQFENILSATGYSKTQKIENYIKQSGVAKDKILYIGDEIRDILSCKKNGIDVLSVTWGVNSKDRLIKNKPKFIADKPQDILKILNQ